MPADCLASDIDFAITSRNEIVARAERAWNPPAPKKSREDFMSNARVLATDLEFPEGPVVMPDGSVGLVELRGRRVTRVWPDGRKQVVAEIRGGPNGAAIGPDGRCYICNNGGFSFKKVGSMMLPGIAPPDYTGGWIEAVDLKTGQCEVIYRNCGDIQLRGPNDLIFDQYGGFWFTDTGKIMARQS